MRRATTSAISPLPSSSMMTSQAGDSALRISIARYWMESGSLSFVCDSMVKVIPSQSIGARSARSNGGLCQVGL